MLKANLNKEPNNYLNYTFPQTRGREARKHILTSDFRLKLRSSGYVLWLTDLPHVSHRNNQAGIQFFSEIQSSPNCQASVVFYQSCTVWTCLIVFGGSSHDVCALMFNALSIDTKSDSAPLYWYQESHEKRFVNQTVDNGCEIEKQNIQFPLNRKVFVIWAKTN